MNTIKNANGNTYYIEAKFEAGLDNVYLLSYYGNKTEEEIQAGANPVQYVVARGWSEKHQCWNAGSYFMVWDGNHVTALQEAEQCFEDHVERIKYYNF